MKQFFWVVFWAASVALAAAGQTAEQSMTGCADNPATEGCGTDCSIWKWSGLLAAGLPNDVVACLNAGTDPNERYEDYETSLHWVAEYNSNPAVVQVLIAAGADVNARDEDGETPLHRAAGFNENPAVTQALIDAGGDTNARDD